MKQQAGNLPMNPSPENCMLRARTIFSVDITTEKLMMSLLRSEFEGWTVIAIVHRLSSIRDFDQVVVLDQGQIIEYGSPMALLANEGSAFAKLYRNGGEQSY
jgi:ABC-type multidrug transport system fused ATPase/permease subunit